MIVPFQDCTYAGLTENEDNELQALTVWVALTKVTTKSGCMKFLPGTHATQLPHVVTNGSSNMLAFGQTIPAELLTLDTAIDVTLDPGEFSIHHFRLAHCSGPNADSDRRIGFAIRYVATHVRKSGTVRELATLVRGQDEFGHFDLEPVPLAEMDEAAIRAHKEAMSREDANYFEGRK